MRAWARAAGRKFDDELTSSKRAARAQQESGRSLQSTRASESAAWTDRSVVKTSINEPGLDSRRSSLVVQVRRFRIRPGGALSLSMTITRPSTCDGSFPPRVLLFVEVVERHVQPALAAQRIVNKLLDVGICRRQSAGCVSSGRGLRARGWSGRVAACTGRVPRPSRARAAGRLSPQRAAEV